MRKAQYSMEFLIFFGILSVLFVVWLIVYLQLNEDAFARRDERAITDIGKAVQLHVFTASTAHSGYSSSNLFIPTRADTVEFSINNTPYIFYLRTSKQDYVFHIPYLLGKLKPGQNTLWNVNGVVAVGTCPPVIKSDGSVNFPQCADGIDNDGDLLTDEEDGNCLMGTVLNCNNDDESTGGGYVYYTVCMNAQAYGLCDLLDLYPPPSKAECCVGTGGLACC